MKRNLKYAFVMMLIPAVLLFSSFNFKGENMQTLPIIKVGRNNKVFITKKPESLYVEEISLKELPKYLEKFKKEYETIVYFREGAFFEPEGEYDIHIKKVLDIIMESGISVKMGNDYLKEMGEVTDFVCHITPDKFRLGANKGETLVVAVIPEGEDKWMIFKSDLKSEKHWKENLAVDFGMIFHSNRMMSQKPNGENKAFNDKYMNKSAVHISVVINREYEWLFYYETDKMPGNVRSFVDDCAAMADLYIPENYNK